jgi:arylsulfatase I/J
VPQKELDLFSFIKEPRRQLYHAMVYFVDSAIGRVAQRIKDEGMWDNTLIVLSSDNGGPVSNVDNGANNYPLRGGKFSNFEGGIRVNAFASGGLLPKHVRGTKQEGVMAGWDWYATFAALAGVDPTDKKAAAAGLPPHDSINMWPLLSGQVTTSPRKELELGSAHMNHHTTVAGLIWGQHKILTGKVTSPFWTGPVYPNTTVTPGGKGTITCGEDVETGCLFDVVKDPTEHVNIAKENADLFKQMLSRVQELRKNVFDPDRGSIDPLACRYGLEKYGGFFGPFIDVEPLEQSFEALV